MTDRIVQLQALLQAEPDDSFCLYGLAMEYMKAGQDAEAITYFDRTIAVDPDTCYAYFHKARVLESMDDDAGAIATLRLGIERATACGDEHALSELAGYLDQVEP